MSRYEWESGTFKIPTKEIPKIRKAVREFTKELTELMYQETLKSYEYENLSARKKKLLGKTPEFDDSLIFYSAKAGKRIRPTKARAKQSVFTSFQYNGHDVFLLQQEGASVRFDPTERLLSWRVDTNNHARERAYDSEIGIWFYKLMDTIKWTRGSGGTMVGNDEYNKDDTDVGGGGNYIIAEYGPKRKTKAGRKVLSSYY